MIPIAAADRNTLKLACCRRDKKQISGGTELAGLPVHTIAFNFNILHNDDAFVPSGSVKSSYGIDSCPRLSGMDTVGPEIKIVIQS